MGKPAARLTDMHVCPMQTPAFPSPIPHVGGPVSGPGAMNVLIGKMPAARISDMCVCTGPPDSIIMGSTGVLIGKMPAARMGDSTAHGGTIVAGCFTVMIGEVGVVPPTVIPPAVVIVHVSVPGSEKVTTSSEAIKEMVQNGSVPPQIAPMFAQVSVLLDSARKGTPFCEKCEKAKKELEEMEDSKPQEQHGLAGYVTDPEIPKQEEKHESGGYVS